MSRLSPLGPTRAIAILPGGGAILEASSNSAAWDLKMTEMPSGKTLLTAALPDKSFELHVDVAQVAPIAHEASVRVHTHNTYHHNVPAYLEREGRLGPMVKAACVELLRSPPPPPAS